MSLKTSIVGVQVKHIKGALQYLAKIGEGTCQALFMLLLSLLTGTRSKVLVACRLRSLD